MGKSKGKLDALLLEAAGVELDPKKVLKMEPEERASWLSTACRVASEGAVKVSQLYNVLASEKFADGLNEKVGKRMHRTMLKYLHIFSDKQQRYLKQCGLARDFGLNDKEASKELPDVKPARRKSQSDEDAAVRMEEMMARCRNFVREKAQTYEERMREAEEQEREARRQEMLRREREERERLAREWAEIAHWHRQLEGWELSQLAIEDLREQERAREAQEVREALEGKKSRSRSKRKRPLEEDQPWPAEEQMLEEELRRAQHGHDDSDLSRQARQEEARRQLEEQWHLEHAEREEEEARWQQQQAELWAEEEARWQAVQKSQEEARRQAEQQHKQEQDRAWAEHQRRMEAERWQTEQRRLAEERWWQEQQQIEEKRRQAEVRIRHHQKQESEHQQMPA